MAKKFLGLFDKRPLIWFHYVLLEAIILAFGYLSASYSYGKLISFFEMYSILSIVGLYFAISVGDQIIHAILNVD
jgi:hypothetical protein